MALSKDVLLVLARRLPQNLAASFVLSACLSLSRAAAFSGGLPFAAPSWAAVKSTTFPTGAGSPMPGIVGRLSSLPRRGAPSRGGAEISLSLGTSVLTVAGWSYTGEATLAGSIFLGLEVSPAFPASGIFCYYRPPKDLLRCEMEKAGPMAGLWEVHSSSLYIN